MLNYFQFPWPTHVLWAHVLPSGQPPLVPLHKCSWTSAAGLELVEENRELGDSDVAMGEWELGSLGVLTFSAGLCPRALMQPLWEGGSQPPAYPEPSPGATLRPSEDLTARIVVPSHLHTMLERKQF